MRTAQERRVISSNECDYACMIVDFFRASCAPGAADPAHHPSKVANVKKLCDACTGFSPRNGNEQGVVHQGTFPSPPQGFSLFFSYNVIFLICCFYYGLFF